MACGTTSEVNFAEGEELAKVKELMTKLEPEVATLKEAGLDFPHTTGEIFFTRLLRGNNGNLDEAVEWYRKFLQLRKTFGLDDVHKDCEAKNISWVASQMPDMKAMEPYATMVFDENELRCPNGNLMWYDAIGDFKSQEIFKEIGEEKFIKLCHYIFERRTSTIDKLSRADGKLIKITRIMDFEGASMSTLTNKAYKAVDEKSLKPVLLGTSIESVHLCFLINFPKFFVKAFEVFKLVFPKRLVARFRVLGTNYLQDKEFLTECGADITKKVVACSKVHAAGGVEDETFKMESTTETNVPAGSVLERVVEVQPGQTVSWQFTMGPSGSGNSGGYFSRLAGKVTGSEVYFSAKAFWTDKQANEIDVLSAKVESAGVEDGDSAAFFVGGAEVAYTAGAGVNLVAVDPTTKALITGQAFDMTKDSDAANKAFVSAIQELPRACFVLVGVKGTGAEELSEESWSALQDCGSTLKGGGHWHKGYAFCGVKGGVAVSEMRGGKVTAEGEMPTQEVEAVLYPSIEANADNGEKTGAIKVERGGMLILKWSNEHAMVASKNVAKYKISCE